MMYKNKYSEFLGSNLDNLFWQEVFRVFRRSFEEYFEGLEKKVQIGAIELGTKDQPFGTSFPGGSLKGSLKISGIFDAQELGDFSSLGDYVTFPDSESDLRIVLKSFWKSVKLSYKDYLDSWERIIQINNGICGWKITRQKDYANMLMNGLVASKNVDYVVIDLENGSLGLDSIPQSVVGKTAEFSESGDKVISFIEEPNFIFVSNPQDAVVGEFVMVPGTKVIVVPGDCSDFIFPKQRLSDGTGKSPEKRELTEVLKSQDWGEIGEVQKGEYISILVAGFINCFNRWKELTAIGPMVRDGQFVKVSGLVGSVGQSGGIVGSVSSLEWKDLSV